MSHTPKLNIMETEIAIKQIKDFYERALAEQLDLTRVSAPLFVVKASGLNDNLNGTERPVNFDIKDFPGEDVEIVHSLAKWKRAALKRYGFAVGKGLYTDMNAIRRDEDLDELHSVYVDQWDWEKIISREQRNTQFLKQTVTEIYSVFKKTEEYITGLYPCFTKFLPENIFFISAQELEDMYGDMTPKEREHAIAKKHGAVFISQIGGKLSSGNRHDGRAPDYDDWGLNGDILFWYPPLGRSVEITSMGIRVDEKSLLSQLKAAGCEDRLSLPYHQGVLNGELPLTIGGGLGQSRICMIFLEKAHIGEVHASVWPDEIIRACEAENIYLL